MDGFNNGFQGGPPPMNPAQTGMPPNWNMPVMPPAFMNWMYGQGGNQNPPPMMLGVGNASPNMNPNNTWNGNPVNPQVNVAPNNTMNTQSNDSNQQPSRQTILCGIVSGPDDIKPGEVPMNGGVGMFVKNDLSEIYVKQWGSDGTIHTRSYAESIVDVPSASQVEPGISLQDVLDNVNARFERMESLISSLYNSNQNKQRSNQNNGQKNNQNKEVANNG